jgi:DNA-binding response OmpR family regulator
MDRTILIVDDEADIRDILQFNLENAGFNVDAASSAEQALEIPSEKHSLILLDVMMGGISGFKMAETLRGWGNEIPIIFLTAKDRQDDLLTGFSAGADDYISKPFSIQEVIARVHAVLKRSELRKPQSGANPDLIQVGKVSIDVQKKTVTVDGEPVVFSKKEFEILRMLLEHLDQVFSREEILTQIWSDEVYVLNRTIDVNITRLRRKIGPYGKCIVTRQGYGYCFES